MFRRLTLSVSIIAILCAALYFQQLPANSTKEIGIAKNTKSTILQPPQEENLRPVRMLFFGDMMLGRFVRTLIERNGADALFAKIKQQKSYFDGYADLIIANLEGPIVSNPIYHSSGTTFGFAPDTAQIVKKSGIDLVSLANNHTLDRGAKGLEETRKYLTEAGVEFFGDPILPQDKDIMIKKIRGKTFAFLGFHDATRRLDEIKAAEIVKKYNTQVDHIIVYIHWGAEYRETPVPRQVELAHLFVDNGADLIIGHHPHWVQIDEVYKGVPVYYSLGNFVFDQYWSEKTQQGLAVEIEWKAQGPVATELPISLYKSIPVWK